MKSLVVVLAFFLVLSSSLAVDATTEEPGTWAAFKGRFIMIDGRVIDPWQGGITHSEGQGYGMLLAVAHDDQDTFIRLWNWTREHLQVRKTDHLLAWSWGKLPVGIKAPLDFNNASDGDVCAAWALLLARQQWNQPSWEDEARKIIADLRRLVVLERYGHTMLLPGYTGFVRKDSLTLNPSYWVLPAFAAFARVDDPLFWQRVIDQSHALLATARFGPMELPPDWLLLNADGHIKLDKERPPLFGYEAIRVFLWAALDDSAKDLPGIHPLLVAMDGKDVLRSTVNLQTGQPGPNPAPAGFLAIGARCARSLGEPGLADRLAQRAASMIPKEGDDYYSQVLYLLAQMSIGQH